jgi:hypothetical protein
MADRKKDDRGAFESLGEAAGRIAGKMTDTAFSATGTVFDSMTAMLGAWWSGEGAKRAAGSFDENRDRACREHFQSRAQRSGAAGGSGTGAGASASAATRDYERARPLYRFGHVAGQNPDYQGRSFGEIENDLRSAWERGGSREHGDWDEVRDYIGYGFGTGSPGLDDSDISRASSWMDRERGGGI